MFISSKYEIVKQIHTQMQIIPEVTPSTTKNLFNKSHSEPTIDQKINVL